MSAATVAQRSLVVARLTDRVAEGRTSVQAHWQPCRPRASQEHPGCDVASLSVSDLGSALSYASALSAALETAPRATRLHHRALIDLRFAPHKPVAIDRAITTLSDAASANPDPHVLNDLAVALLIRADAQTSLLDYLGALDAASRAVALAPTWPPARFNQALLMERLELRHSARAAWKRIIASEPDSLWRNEAQAHLAAVPRSTGAKIGWSLDVARDSIAAHVRQSPQQAREYGMTALATWGQAIRAGQTDSAHAALEVAQAISAALNAMDADRTLSATVAQLGDGSDLRFAAPMAQLRRAITLLENGAYDDGRVLATASRQALERLQSPLWRWAAFYAAFGQINTSHYDAAEVELRRALNAIGRDQPALHGKLVWALGVTELRRGRYDAAARLYREARTYLTRSQEALNIGGISYLLTEALSLAGRTVDSAREALAGLHALADFDRSDYLNDHLHNVAALARRRGLPSAGLTIADEVVETARLTARPQVLAWAMRDRAADHVRFDDTAAAARDLQEGYRAAIRLQQGVGRQRVMANLDLVHASVISRQLPESAAVVYRRTIDEYRRLNLVNYVPSAMTDAARNALRARDTAGATAYLNEAMQIVEAQSARFESNAVRASFSESVDALYDAAIELAVERDETSDALEMLARAQLAPWRGALRRHLSYSTRRLTPEQVGRILQPREAVLVYAVLRDRLVIWYSAGGGWKSLTQSVGRREIAQLVEAGVRSLSDLRTDVDPAMQRLHELLLLPLRADLKRVQHLVIVPDYDLGRLPFAALRSATTGRYLIEDYSIRSVPSLVLLAPLPRSRLARPSALIVGSASGPANLPPLPGAVEEARGVAAAYSRYALHDETLTIDRFASAIGKSSIFHFAGHAVTNGDEPELSFLALGPQAQLTGQRIASLRLEGMEVAVLSACSTQGAFGRRGSMTSGLAFSFLLAGAGATISTLWNIADSDTRAMQVPLHQALARGAPAREALRDAQLSLLRSPKAQLRRPGIWAAFVVSGR